jgi:hypothetical protein
MTAVTTHQDRLNPLSSPCDRSPTDHPRLSTFVRSRLELAEERLRKGKAQ